MKEGSHLVPQKKVPGKSPATIGLKSCIDRNIGLRKKAKNDLLIMQFSEKLQTM